MKNKKEKTKSNYASGQAVISLALIDYLKMLERLRPDLWAVIGERIKSEKGKYKDRIIDIDILMYGTSIIDSPNLTIPHKFMKERRFVLEPLAEIASEVVIPGTGISVSKALNLLIHKSKSDQ